MVKFSSTFKFVLLSVVPCTTKLSVCVYLQLVGFAMLDEEVDELCRVLHEVDVLVHRSVHDQQPAFLLWQLVAGMSRLILWSQLWEND